MYAQIILLYHIMRMNDMKDLRIEERCQMSVKDRGI